MKPSSQSRQRHNKHIAASCVPGIPEDFEMTPEFSNALDRMENSGDHLFITGNAGTGKSVLLQYFNQNTNKKIVVVAPTGVAALNVGGSTIHSFFQFPPRLITREDAQQPIRKKRKLFQSLDAVVVDEVSMVRADVMDAIDYSLRANRNRLDEPFGGVQMILFGDLHQLSPVVERKLEAYFADTYGSPFFFSANAIKHSQPSTIELQRVFRQTDPQFIEVLNKVRNNQITTSNLHRLNDRLNSGVAFTEDELVISLTSTNKLASSINQDRLNALSSPEHCFTGTITGDFDSKSCPTDEHLCLKEGAQVMMVKNDPNKRWVNGSLGVIQELTQDSIEVSFEAASYPIKKVTWEEVDYEYNPSKRRIEPVETGTFRQYPIKLAWAITIHKSQGKTFEKVIIDLRHRAFAAGQVYVALSRCRSFQGIQLRTPIRWHDIRVDNRVIDFLSRGNDV